MNQTGPKTDPCGTPLVKIESLNISSFDATKSGEKTTLESHTVINIIRGCWRIETNSRMMLLPVSVGNSITDNHPVLNVTFVHFMDFMDQSKSCISYSREMKLLTEVLGWAKWLWGHFLGWFSEALIIVRRPINPNLTPTFWKTGPREAWLPQWNITRKIEI